MSNHACSVVLLLIIQAFNIFLQGPVFYQFGYQVNDNDKYFGHNYHGHMEHVDGEKTTGIKILTRLNYLTRIILFQCFYSVIGTK